VLAIASRGAVPEWFGNKVRHGTVVYLAGEGHHGLRGRVAAWKQHKAVTGLDMWLSRHGLDLNTPAGFQKVVDSIRALPEVPGVIVVDTLHRFLDGDENSSVDAKSMLDACSALIQEFGASVMLVHHTGVSVEAQHRARGSSAWRGALDIEISVVPGETIEILQRKSKDSEEAKPIWVELKSVPITGWLDEDGEQVASAVLERAEEPVRAKKDGPLIKHQKTLANAWWVSGAEISEGAPYITRSALARKLQGDGLADRTVENMMNPSYDSKLIGALMMANMIDKHRDGWVVTDQIWAASMLISRAPQSP